MCASKAVVQYIPYTHQLGAPVQGYRRKFKGNKILHPFISSLFCLPMLNNKKAKSQG